MIKQSATFMLVAALFISAPMAANADDPRIDEIDAVNPDLSRADFDASVRDIAEQQGLSPTAVIDLLYSDSAAARTNQTRLGDQGGMSNRSSGGSGGGQDFSWVKVGCAAPGYFTYSYARNAGVAHGHNTLFTEACKGVHMPGGAEKYIREFNQTSTLKHHPSYPAHIRRVNGASASAHASAAAFGKTNLTRKVQYNTSFAWNKTAIWQTHYNCSSLVWAAWMYATGSKTDLDRNGGPGVYPEDIWKSPVTVLNRYMTA